MNPLDLVAILLVILAVVLGFNSGALPQVGGLLGAVGGGALLVLALPVVVGPLDSVPVNVRPYVVLAGLLMAVGIGESVGSAIGRTAARSLGSGFLGAADRLAGSITGAAQALLIVWLAGGLLAIGPVPRLTEAAQTSTAIRTLNAVLPPPTEIATGLGSLLDDSGLPDVFVGFEPLPRPPVDDADRRDGASDRRAGRRQHGADSRRCLRRAGIGQWRRRGRRVRRHQRPCRRRGTGWGRHGLDRRRRPRRRAGRPVRPGARRGTAPRAGPPSTAAPVRDRRSAARDGWRGARLPGRRLPHDRSRRP